MAGCVSLYKCVRSLDCPGPFRGNVIRIVVAGGSRSYGAVSWREAAGSKVKGIVSSWPERVVSAWLIFRAWRRGRRNWDVHPAPRIRRATGSVVQVDGQKESFGVLDGGLATRLAGDAGESKDDIEVEVRAVGLGNWVMMDQGTNFRPFLWVMESLGRLVLRKLKILRIDYRSGQFNLVECWFPRFRWHPMRGNDLG